MGKTHMHALTFDVCFSCLTAKLQQSSCEQEYGGDDAFMTLLCLLLCLPLQICERLRLAVQMLFQVFKHLLVS